MRFHDLCVLLALVYLAWRALRTETEVQQLKLRIERRSLDA